MCLKEGKTTTLCKIILGLRITGYDWVTWVTVPSGSVTWLRLESWLYVENREGLLHMWVVALVSTTHALKSLSQQALK